MALAGALCHIQHAVPALAAHYRDAKNITCSSLADTRQSAASGEGAMANVFISYRRTDTTSGYASWIYDRLAASFGSDHIFMDVDSLPLGVDFAEHVQRALADTDIALILIGPAWLDAVDETGSKRLDDPEDFVRIEVAAALRASFRVIPVLIDGAPIPKANQLPEDLRALTRRQALIFQRQGGAAIADLVSAIKRSAIERGAAAPEEAGAGEEAERQAAEAAAREQAAARDEPERVAAELGPSKPHERAHIGAELPLIELGGVRAAAAIAVGGAITAVVSVIAHDSAHNLDHAFFRVPIALMALAIILLVVSALRSNSRTPLLFAAGLALALLGVAFPMSWRPGPLPTTFTFWLGACGAASAAGGAAFAAWRAYPEAPGAARARSDAATPGVGRMLLVIPGPLIVIGSLFVLREWSKHSNTTWLNWDNDDLLRYPSTIVLLSGVTLVLAVLGIRRNRARLLVMAVGVACLLLGETVPLMFPVVADWGAGRSLRITGAVITLVGVGAAAASTRRAATPTGTDHEALPRGPSAVPTRV